MLIAEAKRQGVQIICFGELFPAPYFALQRDPMWFALAEDAETGPTISEVSRAARELSISVIAPIYEQGKNGRRYNTAVVIDDEGKLLGRYKKTHIPWGANDHGSFDELFYYDASDGDNRSSTANISSNRYFPVFRTRHANIGVAICYDRHFEGVMYTLAGQGAEIVFSPAVTFGSKSERMWPLEFPVDAARHNVFIAGSNRAGSEPPWNQPYFGRSYVVGPNGPCEDVSRHERIVIADVDLAMLDHPDPSGWNLPRDTKPEIYDDPG